MRDLILIAIAGAMVGIPVVGVVAFVQARAKSREAKLAAPWGELARRWGGSYAAGRVFCDRLDHQLSLEMVLVSVLQAASGPYYPDGGTYTKARVALDPRGAARIAEGSAVRVDHVELTRLVPGSGTLPPAARVIVAEREAVIVLPGAVGDLALLEATFETLEGIRQHVLMNGAISIRATAQAGATA